MLGINERSNISAWVQKLLPVAVTIAMAIYMGCRLTGLLNASAEQISPLNRTYGVAGILHIVILCLLSAALLLYIMRAGQKDVAAESMFLVCWLLVSALYLCASPLFNVPDEYAHFFRALEISYGKMVSKLNAAGTSGGDDLPIGAVSMGKNLVHVSWETLRANIGVTLTEETTFAEFSNTATYSPISYLPQALGILLARSVTDNVAVIAYGGRLANWLAITAFLYGAMKYLPWGKTALALIALIPMNISECVSMAPDGMVVALSAFMIAYVLHLRQTKQLLRGGAIAMLYGLAVAISLYKIVYLPICLIYLLIPAECCGGVKRRSVFTRLRL